VILFRAVGFFLFCVSFCQGDFVAYNDCIRGSGDGTAANVTNWTIYNGFTSQTSGLLRDFDSGLPTSVSATFTWNSSAGLAYSSTSGSADGESQPRPGTPAYEVFGGIVDFSNQLIMFGSAGWWVKIDFTGLNPDKKYSFVTTAICGAVYSDRITLFTLSNHLSADNNSSDGVYLKNGDQTMLLAGGNHLDTTGYVVRWDNIRVADQGDGTGRFSVQAQAYGANYRAYPFGGFLLEEIGNMAPSVDAGPDRILSWPQEYLTLNGLVSDDGEGEPDGFLESTWSQVSGPQQAEFVTDIHQPQVQVRFPAVGEYVLQLAATDGDKESSNQVTVTVGEPLCPVGDQDSDCRVTLEDLAALAEFWLAEGGAAESDLDGDGVADAAELMLLSQSWLENWTGSLRVTILPAAAAADGAQWRLEGGPWQSSGAIVDLIPEGLHTVEYSTVPDWLAPEPQTAQIVRQQITSATGQYLLPPACPVINEFLAVNSNVFDLRPVPSVNLYTYVDGQMKYEDWIELRNVQEEPISLEGWYLTDDPDNLTKWRFPAGTTIPAMGYLIVYASNKEESKYPWPFVDDLGYLHTNFELSAGGEYLALVRPNGRRIEYEYNDYPPQRGLVSYGIGSDGRIGYLTSVSRGAANPGIYEGIVADTQFSADRGFYEAPFTVHLTCSTPGAVIYYTTNNSEPTLANGNIYNPASPISITTTTCLRAAAFKSGYLPSNIDTQTYIFLDKVVTQATNPSTGAQVVPAGYPTTWPGGSQTGAVTGDYQVDPDIASPTGLFGSVYAAGLKDDLMAIPSISIVVPIDQLFGTTTGIYINQGQDGTERAGSVELIDPDGLEAFHTNCGVRMQGGASLYEGGTTLNRWKSYKLSFRLTFRGVYGGKLDYPLFGPEGAEKFDTIVLDSRPQNSWVHTDSTQRLRGEYVRDQVSSDTQIAMGGYACRGRPVHLYLNGLYWGLYWMHERPDDSFAASYLGGQEDDYDVIKHDYNNVISGSNDDYIAMFALSASSPNAVTAFNNLAAKLDVADFIDYLLANFYLGNNDWDHKNWYATHNRFDPAGRWRWHMWDGEHVMDDGTYTVIDATTKNNYMAPTGLHQKWIANAEYRMLFADRVHKHFFHDGVLTPSAFAALFTNLTSQIDRAIVGESARWGDNRRSTPYTRNIEWVNECNRLLTNFIPTRRDVVLAQFTGKNPAWYPAVTAPEFYVNGAAQYGGDAPAGSSLTMSTGGNTVWYTLDGSDPRLPGGAINTASAAQYTTGISLSASVLIKARARTGGGVWSALAEAVFDVGPVRENLRVTELMYHPDDPNHEFVELKNIGTEALNLSRVQFTRGLTHTFGNVSIAPGGFLLLVKNQPAFEAYYTGLPSGVPVVQWTAGSLDNAGETLTMIDALGRVIQSFTYKDSWYPLTDGGGFSLTILDAFNPDPAVWSRKAGWRTSTTSGGSPGADETGLAADSIVINELLAHSDNTLPDWIELHNSTGQAISVGGWFLSDSGSDLMKYAIPESTEIPAYGYVVFYEDLHFGTAFALSENGETLYLTSGTGGQLSGYQAVQSFDASERGVSLGRYVKSDGDMDFVAMSEPTPGGANAYPQVGPVVISEIQYNPAPANTGDEYLELHNLTGAPVTLQDLVKTETSPGVFFVEPVSWSFTDGIDFTFPAGTQIPAGGFLIVAKNPAAFNACYAAVLPQGTAVLGPFENGTALSNGGEKVRLCRPGEKAYGQPRNWIRVDQVNYDDQSPWPTQPDGGGSSLQRIILSQYGNDPANWTAGAPAPGQ
jgi:hypothetical protein